MKQPLLSLLAAVAISSSPAFAQEASTDPAIGLRLPTQKGSAMVGSSLLVGELAFGATSEDHHTAGSYNAGISPKAGYFVMDNLMVGASLNANFQGSNIERSAVGSGYHSQSVGVGVFARKYFGKATDKHGELKKFRPFVEVGAGHNRGWSQMDLGDRTEHGNFNTTTVNIMPGFNYFFNKNVALEAGLNYSGIVDSKHVIGNSSNLRFSVGLQFFLGGKKK